MKPIAFDMMEPSATMNSSVSRRKKTMPKTSCSYFRVAFQSNHALSTANGNTWEFQLNAPEEMSPGLWCMQVETIVMSGDDAAITNADRVCDFHVSGIPIRDSYECTQQQDSTLLLSTVRYAGTYTFARNVTFESLGVPLADVGQLRGRRVTVTIRNGNGVALQDDGLTHWRMVVVFYLLDD